MTDAPNGGMTPAEVTRVLDNTLASMIRGGTWDKMCNQCNGGVGARLAEYGKPGEDDLKRLACPHCGNSGPDGPGFRLEFTPGR